MLAASGKTKEYPLSSGVVGGFDWVELPGRTGRAERVPGSWRGDLSVFYTDPSSASHSQSAAVFVSITEPN